MLDPALSQTTVHFDSNPIEEVRNLQALEEQIQRIVTLNKQVKQMDRKLGLTKEYIQFSAKQGKGSGGGNASGLMAMESDMMELDYAAHWADEDPEEAMMPDFED
jgi:COP9 signalosome complex subunit 3